MLPTLLLDTVKVDLTRSIYGASFIIPPQDARPQSCFSSATLHFTLPHSFSRLACSYISKTIPLVLHSKIGPKEAHISLSLVSNICSINQSTMCLLSFPSSPLYVASVFLCFLTCKVFSSLSPQMEDLKEGFTSLHLCLYCLLFVLSSSSSSSVTSIIHIFSQFTKDS